MRASASVASISASPRAASQSRRAAMLARIARNTPARSGARAAPARRVQATYRGRRATRREARGRPGDGPRRQPSAATARRRPNRAPRARAAASRARASDPTGAASRPGADPRAGAWRTRPPATRRRRGAPRARRGGAPSFDPERERAFGDVAVDREHAPLHLVRSRPQRRKRRAQQRRVRAVDAAVPAVDLHTLIVQDAEGAVRGLEALGEVQLDLFGRTLQLALDARLRPLENGVPCGGGRGQRAGGERETESPRARSPDGRHGADVSLS